MPEPTFLTADTGMPDRTVLTTQFGAYEYATWDGANRSGIQPLCDKVLVLPDQPAGAYGNILIPDDIKEKVGFAATTGVMVAVGPQAFAYDAHRLVHWEGERPKIGSRIYFQKYAGLEFTGRDGLMYRVMEDRQIAAMEMPETG